MSTIENELVGRFSLGRIVITRGAFEVLLPEDTLRGLFRHANSDWGDVGNEDTQSNEIALNNGGRLFSSYRTKSGTKFWIITEHDRSITTILLPKEY